ncbi:MAG: hypothetical protein WA825_08380 [Steroidobacteraceae bacterium]
MDHQQAIQLGAVEKYLLDELPIQLRSEFEEHFFGCQECAADLHAAAEFLDIARKEFRRGNIASNAAKPLKRSWLEVLARPAVLSPAFALLLGIVVYQNSVVLPRFSDEIALLRQPGVVATVSLIGGNSRGGALPSVSGTAGQPVLLSLDIPATRQYPSYACLLIDASGTVVWRLPVSAAQAQDTVSISVPAGALRAGDYTLVVQGVEAEHHGADSPQSTDLARYRFALSPSH